MPTTTGTRAPAPADRATPMPGPHTRGATPSPAPARCSYHCPECGQPVHGAQHKVLRCGWCRARFRVLKRTEARL